MSYQHC